MTDFPKDTSHFQLIVSDFDGTLVGKERRISAKVKQAIEKWENSGRHFVIATGRNYLMIKQDLEDMNLKSPVIFHGGAEIIDPQSGISLFSECIPQEDAKRIVDMLAGSGFDVVIDIEDKLYTDIDYGKDYTFFKKLPLSDFNESAPKINVREREGEQEKVYLFMEELKKQFPMLHLTRSYNPSGRSWDITSLKATKHMAVLELLKILNIERNNSVGVGDGYNDFPLLEATALKVAMGNAHDELKAVASLVIPSYEEDGVAFLIEKLLKEN